MAAARYWRIVGLDARAGGDLELSALHLYGSAGRLDDSVTLTSTLAPAAGALSALQDGDLGTACRFAAAAVRAPGFALMWDFGATPVDVTEVRLGSADAAGTFAAGMQLQSSSDGATWVVPVELIGRIVWPGPRAMVSVGIPVWQEQWFESFDGGIPANFANVVTDSGTLIVTPEPATGSVMLDASGYNTAWMFNGRAAQNAVRMEFDIEIITPSYGNTPYIGVVLMGGPQVLQNLLGVGSTTAASSRSNNATNIGLQVSAGSTNMPVANPSSGRALWSFSSAPAGGGTRDYAFSVGGNEVVLNHNQTPPDAMLTTGLFLRSCRVRLHSVRSLARVAGGMEPRPVQALERGVLRFFSRPVAPFTARAAAGAHHVRDMEFGGAGRIWGSTKIKTKIEGTPNVPTRARVVLLRQRDKLLARETWSDPATGAFAFEGIDTRQEWITLAEDAAGAYRPVAANKLVPEVAS